MSRREVRRAPAMPGGGQSPAKATLVAGSGRKRSRTRQDPWEETHWSHQRWGRAAPGLRGVRAGSLARGRSEAAPENAARERSRVRTLRQAFLALQAALPAVPPGTKLSKLDVLVLATSYIAHLTRTLGRELPGPAWPPFLRGLRYLHPLKVGPSPALSSADAGTGRFPLALPEGEEPRPALGTGLTLGAVGAAVGNDFMKMRFLQEEGNAL
ncbi:transcription factor 23 isoform X1 [Hyaena hyaena]|uniref:transcription factor 23 isoform X1 n=1 Tax=Hyaena hyaena TaxID=95912 RepID=UPI0019236365|nr:transcription factor 23 isoform X1 [Hyaena hyaena]